MGHDPFILHQSHIAKLLTAPERAKLGVQTPSESQQRWQAREERKIHSDLTAWLQCKGVPFIHSRMDKPSTIRKGWPDFTCMNGVRWNAKDLSRVCCVEVKAPGGVLSDAQAECIAELKLAHVPVLVAYSAKQAIDFIIGELLT